MTAFGKIGKREMSGNQSFISVTAGIKFVFVANDIRAANGDISGSAGGIDAVSGRGIGERGIGGCRV